MSESTNKQIVNYFFEQVVNGHNPAVIDELMVEEVIDHNSRPADAAGREAIREAFLILHAAFPDFWGSIEDMVAEGDTVTVRWTMQGTHSGAALGICPSGRRMRCHGIDVLKFRDGKISERSSNSDQYGMLRQLGLIEARGDCFTAHYRQGVELRERPETARLRSVRRIRVRLRKYVCDGLTPNWTRT